MSTAVVQEQYLFGIDLDGTLLSPRGKVTDRTRAAIQAVVAAGHKVCFATGRNYTEAELVFEAVGHRDLVTLVSGAIVADARTGEWLVRSAMHPSLAIELCATIERMGFAAVAFEDRRATGVDYLVSQDRAIHQSLNVWLELSGQRVERKPALAKLDHQHTLRVSTVSTYEEADAIRRVIEKEFGDRVYVHGVRVVSDGAEILEMFDPAVNKWQGLLWVAGKHGIPQERIIAIGDDTNDLPMLKNASLGCAMGQARDEVKQAADRVIGSNAVDGLAVFLEEWLATKPALV